MDHKNPCQRHRRHGVLLLVVLSMLTLFMLLGVTYLVLAARVRSTSRAFLRLADDQAQDSIAAFPALRRAALQVFRGAPANSTSVIKGHDLLADKYGASTNRSVTGVSMVAGGQMLKIQVAGNLPSAVTGRVLTIINSAPSTINNTSSRVVAADAPSTIYIMRPSQLPSGESLSLIKQVWINGSDFSGDGFSNASATGQGVPSLDAAAFQPNAQFASMNGTPNEDYDAIDEQNWAIATADGQSERSFSRRAVTSYWASLLVNDLAATAVAESKKPALMPPDLDSGLLNLRRATMRPFAFDHWQDSPGGTDFTGKPLNAAVITGNPADVDNDGDGLLDSVWLDLGETVIKLGDGKRVKPLFAVHCIDLGGRVNINAHGSPTQLSEAAVASDPRLAVDRGLDGSKRNRAQYLRGGLGFGPADVRLDAVLNSSDVVGVIAGTTSAGGVDAGIRRDVPPVVGRYGDGVGSPSSPALPGRPGTNDRRPPNDAALWTDRGLPETYWSTNSSPSLFGGSPPDFWARLSVGIDHRGQPVYMARNNSVSVNEATDNPYELNLSRPKPSSPYVGYSEGWVDQPFTAAELEAVLRPFDIDNAAGLPPRALAMALAGGDGSLGLNRRSITTESWDTPAVISTDLVGVFATDEHDPDLVAGLKMDLNRPFGDGKDNDGNNLVDEPGENDDAYAAAYAASTEDTSDGKGRWLLTRGYAVGVAQPGPDKPHLRARQLYAWNLFYLLKTIRTRFAALGSEHALRLFALSSDDDTSTPPVAKDASLNTGGIGDSTKQEAYNDKVLAQWAVNVVDFIDPDAIMTPFRYRSGGTSTQYVVWGCEFPDVMISETLAFHDRRTADTDRDPTKETTAVFRDQYKAKYDVWMAWKAGGKVGPEPAYPQPTNADGTAAPDDMDFDQVRIPEGSLFIELYGTRSPTTPNLPRELYTFENGRWQLDLGRTPQPNSPPVWRLSIATNRTVNPTNDIFQKIRDTPDTCWLSPGANPGQVSDTVDVERYIWLSTIGASTTALPDAPGSGASAGPNRDNTFYVQPASRLGNPRLQPGGYLVIGPRPVTAIGSLNGGAGSQKLGVPSKQQIVLQTAGDASNPAVGVFDLIGDPNPSVELPGGAPFGNPLPPPSARTETTAIIVATDPPQSTYGGWGGWNKNTMDGVGTSGIGLNVSEPLRNAYYQCPTVKNPKTSVYDAYGPLDNTQHTNFLPTPLDQAGPLAAKMLSGGTYANFCTVFVERLADPTKPHDPVPTSTDWNPYVVIDFMPIDLTVFNGESTALDPSETQGADRGLAEAIPYQAPFPTSPADPLLPSKVPLPIGAASQLAARKTYFHTRQRGFGSDLPNFDNDQTLFGTGSGQVRRNLHPFKPLGSFSDVQDTPLANSPAGSNILPGGAPTQPRTSGNSACFQHELGQGPGFRPASMNWNAVPYHSLGWVNSSFGRRLDQKDAIDGLTADYYGAPDRPFPWIVWHDRPLANPYELLYVPRTPPGRFFTNYRNLDYPKGTISTPPNPPDYPNVTNTTYNVDDFFAACTPGAHLLPLSSITDVPGPGATRTRNADALVRLFEYVRVRSPFAGTETVLIGTGTDAGPNAYDRPDRLVGPFNRASRYREPGRINLNTIVDEAGGPGAQVWNALCGISAGGTARPSFATVISNTSGFRTATTASGATYVRPFRIARGNRTDYFSTSPSRGWANTIFAAPWAPDPANPSDRLSTRSFTLFGDLPGAPGKTVFTAPDFESCSNDGNKSAWFRFDSFIRANSNATVRSEVYAVWVTMGLFEVESVGAFNARYPDGYRLVREYGSDTGDINRHRAFYIFDRSIPVGYQSGTDLNVQDAILVERFIE